MDSQIFISAIKQPAAARPQGCGLAPRGVFYFLYTLGKLAKRGGAWLPSGATRGCYPQGLLELSEILAKSWEGKIV